MIVSTLHKRVKSSSTTHFADHYRNRSALKNRTKRNFIVNHMMTLVGKNHIQFKNETLAATLIAV